MNKNRMEAFSDGVFAIVITLLILDIKLPHDIPYDQLGAALLAVTPKLQSYVLSFSSLASTGPFITPISTD